MSPSRFIRPMHPKTEIRAEASAIRRVLELGWVGQLKVHGHRAQIHVPADPGKAILVYNRQGRFHKKALPPKAQAELRRLFSPAAGWNVIDAEWLKDRDRIFVFDFLKQDDRLLSDLPFPERWALLPREYLSPHLVTLPLLRTLEKCLDTLARLPDYAEGLVFKSLTTAGFADTSIIRCRVRADK